MISAKDLRLGNYLQDSIAHALIIVTGLKQGNIETTVVDQSSFPLPEGWQAQGVPLTHVTLDQLGFVRSNGYWVKKGPQGFPAIALIEHDNLYYQAAPETMPLRYVHQVQNLYFSTTGRECSYEPKLSFTL